VFDAADQAADAEVARIIKANLGRSSISRNNSNASKKPHG
jgi:hypothetical protein